MAKQILDEVKEKARKLGRKIVLTESDDLRNLQAAAELAQTGYAKPVLVSGEIARHPVAASALFGNVDSSDIPVSPGCRL